MIGAPSHFIVDTDRRHDSERGDDRIELSVTDLFSLARMGRPMADILRRSLPAAVLLLASFERASAASAVDRAAQPYLVGGGLLAAIAFGAIGLVWFFKGVRIRRAAEAIAASPIVEARILESDIVTRVDKDPERADITRYIPRVRYAYAVDGIIREGEVIRLGLGEVGYMSEQQAREHAARYPVGASMPLRCNPNEPSLTALETGQVGSAGKILAGGLFVAVGVAALVFAIWAGALPAR